MCAQAKNPQSNAVCERMHQTVGNVLRTLLHGNPLQLSWKCCFFRCRPQLVLKTCLCVFPTRRPDTADVSATSCDVGFFFSVSYVVSLPNCRHVVVCSNYSLKLSSSRKSTRVLVRVMRQNFGSGNINIADWKMCTSETTRYFDNTVRPRRTTPTPNKVLIICPSQSKVFYSIDNL